MHDVTHEVTKYVELYGGTPNSIESTLATNKVLNFAEGASINKPVKSGLITRVPFTIKFKGNVGSFGADNQFFELTTDIKDLFERKDILNDRYLDANLSADTSNDPYYNKAVIDFLSDNIEVNDYLPALISNAIAFNDGKNLFFSVSMKNKGTGNMYEDSWLDVRLYTKQKEEHPSDEMLIQSKDKLYVGFHARNTRRLGYDVEVTIGTEYFESTQLTPSDRVFLQRIN